MSARPSELYAIQADQVSSVSSWIWSRRKNVEESEAKRQLCKMQGEIADRLSLKTRCVCDDPHGATENSEVPDEVISELWTLLADGYLYRQLRELMRERDSQGKGRVMM